MRIIGCTLFTIGVIVAISGAAKLPKSPANESEPAAVADVPGDDQPTVSQKETFPDTWPVFAGGFLVALVGVSMWWGDVLADRRNARASHDSEAEDSPTSLLARMFPELERLDGELDSLGTGALTARIDELLEHFVHPLAESRQKLIDQFGMSVGAEILVTIAFGERMLNRVWSAAADGHLPEAQSSFRDAADAFKQAHTIARYAAVVA